MSARIDKPARAVTEPPVALAGGETAPERSEGDEGLPHHPVILSVSEGS